MHAPDRRRAPLRATAATLALALAAAGPAAAETVRVFAVGHKQRVADAESVATFRAKMLALVDARLRTPDLVQEGAGDVAGRIRPLDPTAPALAVVHFPEDTGLTAGLIGSRGATARNATSSIEAFATLLGTYADPIAYYDEVFPDLEVHPLRGLVVALTDVLYRSVYETFRDLAREYGVYVSVSVNAAPARRVDAREDAALVERLRDPDEPGRDYAYVAISDLPHNLVWLFDPSGEILVPDGAGGLRRAPSETGGALLPSAAKAYLTPIEQTLDKPGGGLSLASSPVRELDVLDTPVGAIAVVISKDAWMPDVNERFDAKGATFTLQSEAFSSWAFADVPWDPDVFRESGFGTLQSHAGLLFNAAPSMTGNLFDVTFDGQTAILEKRRDKRGPRAGDPGGWIGQLPDTGFVAVAPWIESDPPPGTPAGASLAERRRALAASGARLLPGSGVPCPAPLAAGACENGYREAIVAADLELPPGPSRSGLADGPDAEVRAIDRGRAPTSFGASVTLAPGGRGRQRHPRIAASGDLVAVVWDDTSEGPLPRIRLAVSRDRGARFAAPVRVGTAGPDGGAELFPDVAIHAGEIWVAWQAFDRGLDDDSGRIAFARFDARGRRLGEELRVDGGEDRPAGRWHPALGVLREGLPIVAWIDERDAGPDGVALEHVYAARGEHGGIGGGGGLGGGGIGSGGPGAVARFAPAVRVDAGAPVPLAESMDNRWAPTLAVDAGGTVHVAWVDFRDYNWDVHTARSSDGGRSFGESVRVNGFPDFERICDAPRLVASGREAAALAWTDIRAREPDRNVYWTTTRDAGRSWSADRPLDASSRTEDPDRDVPSNQSHVALAALGADVFAVWQDDRAGNNDALFAALEGGHASPARRIERVDDSGDGPSNQYRPQLAIAGSGRDARCIVVWEDDREGRLRIYGASRRCLPEPVRLPLLARGAAAAVERPID